jgi:tetratricopeptide (TPR) repeat protein
MRAVSISVGSIVLITSLFVSSALGQFSRGFSVSGRLMYANGGFGCEDCEVLLETLGGQVLGYTRVNAIGGFSFDDLPQDTYVIHIAAEGIEEVRQQVEVNNFGNFTMLITMKRKATEVGGSQVVDISQFMQRYPKSAVNLFKKANESAKKGKKADAIKQYEEAVSIAPNFYNAYLNLGMLYREAGRGSDAEGAFLRASQLNKSDTDPLLKLGSLYLQEDRTDQAIEVSEEAVAVNSKSAGAFFNLGVAFYKASRLDRAEDALKKALSLAPKMFQVHLVLANVYAKLRNYDGLKEQLDTYLAENPHGEDRDAAIKLRETLLKVGQ